MLASHQPRRTRWLAAADSGALWRSSHMFSQTSTRTCTHIGTEVKSLNVIAAVTSPTSSVLAHPVVAPPMSLVISTLAPPPYSR